MKSSAMILQKLVGSRVSSSSTRTSHVQPVDLVVFGLGNHTRAATLHSLGQLACQNVAFRIAQENARAAKKEIPDYPPVFKFDDSLYAWTCSLPLSISGDESRIVSQVLFVKSKHLMNNSGLTARELNKRYPYLLDRDRLLVLHDDVEVSDLQIKISQGGSAKGQNGVRSVQEHLKTNKFSRVRLGIGKPVDVPMVEHVMGPLHAAQLKAYDANGSLTSAIYEYIKNLV